jgi:hypothetical protein
VCTIDFQRTLDREVVHRRAVAEVLMTSTTEGEDGSILIGVQVPRHHGLFGDILRSHGGYDPVLFLESVRQSFYVTAHLYRDVPLDRSFIMRDIAFTATDPSLLDYTNAPMDAVLRVRIDREFRDRNGAVTGLVTACELLVDGQVAGEGRANGSWLPMSTMSALRRRVRSDRGLPPVPVPAASPARIAAANVNRHVPLNVVISDLASDVDGDSAVIVVDTTHPTLFDHPLDHLPGMLEIEACRQTAIASFASRGLVDRSWRLDVVAARFFEFAEHDEPAHCHVTLGDSTELFDGSVRVSCTATVTQSDRRLLEADLTLLSAVPVGARHAVMPLVALP